MKILITGGTGFIGFHLIKELLSTTKNQIYCLTRKASIPEKFRQFPFASPQLQRMHFISADITKEEQILKATQGMDLVIHLAASVSSNDTEENYRVNVLGAKNLVKACQENKVKRIIFTSSFTVMEPQPSNYGKTKLQSEEVFKQSGFPTTILRLAMVYGQGGKGFHKFMRNVKKFPFFIPLVGRGDYRRQPLYVEDVVKTILKCIKEEKTAGKTYYLGGPEALSFREMMSIIAEELRIKKIFLPLPLGFLKFLGSLLESILPHPPLTKRDITSIAQEVVFDTSLAEKELEFKPLTFREGVRRTLMNEENLMHEESEANPTSEANPNK